MNLSNSEIAEALRPYGISAAPALCEAIKAYISLLLRWNSKISLTTVTNPLEIVRFHFGESMFAANCIPISKGRLADVGTGAGFPGIPLRMMAPGLSLILIESSIKKAAFLSEIVRELGLDDVQVFRGRMEEFPPDASQLDFVTARALGMHPELLSWSRSHLSGGGRLLLWLGEADAGDICRTQKWDWKDPFAIPHSKRRVILVGSPS